MNLEDIKVSVIIPTYNDSNYILKTLFTVLNQTHHNLEVILIDDLSSDQTLELVKTKVNDKRLIVYQNKENKGVAFSRNFGISKSTGDYVAFLDGDDYWDLCKIEKQLEFMVRNNYYFSSTYYSIVDINDNKIGKYVANPKKMGHQLFLRVCFPGCLTVMYKRSIYPNLSIPNTIEKRNDYALWLKLSEKCDCYCLNEKLAFYRKRKNSISSIKKRSLLKYHAIMFQSLYNFSKFKSWLFAFRNALYFIIKSIFYKRREK